MWNVFDQPWALLAAAGVSFLVIMTYRAALPDRVRPWQFGVPVVLLALAFGLDWVVTTDGEKIRDLVTTAEMAGQTGDLATLERLVAEDYHDSYHKDKRQLLDRARVALTASPLRAVKEISFDPTDPQPPLASVGLIVVATFQQNSVVAAAYKPSMIVKLDFQLAEQPDSRWLIRSIELVEVDKQPVSWARTTGF
jgi:hypothetical protein